MFLRLAFAARYGHTDPSVTLHMPGTHLAAFNRAVARLIEEENAQGRMGSED